MAKGKGRVIGSTASQGSRHASRALDDRNVRAALRRQAEDLARANGESTDRLANYDGPVILFLPASRGIRNCPAVVCTSL